jgi:antitoxin ParD1/3/4
VGVGNRKPAAAFAVAGFG